MSVTFREPVPHPAFDLAEEVEPALFGQKTKIANQIRDSMFFNGSAAELKSRERLAGGSNVFGFTDHSFPVGTIIGALLAFCKLRST
jgi:hypothetical protein